MIILKGIKITNYKSILEQNISLEEMTSFVGANESGKSNILDAINHISQELQDTDFTSNELNLAKHHKSDNVIKIEYRVQLLDFLIPNLTKVAPELLQTEINL